MAKNSSNHFDRVYFGTAWTLISLGALGMAAELIDKEVMDIYQTPEGTPDATFITGMYFAALGTAIGYVGAKVKGQFKGQ